MRLDAVGSSTRELTHGSGSVLRIGEAILRLAILGEAEWEERAGKRGDAEGLLRTGAQKAS